MKSRRPRRNLHQLLKRLYQEADLPEDQHKAVALARKFGYRSRRGLYSFIERALSPGGFKRFRHVHQQVLAVLGFDPLGGLEMLSSGLRLLMSGERDGLLVAQLTNWVSFLKPMRIVFSDFGDVFSPVLPGPPPFWMERYPAHSFIQASQILGQALSDPVLLQEDATVVTLQDGSLQLWDGRSDPADGFCGFSRLHTWIPYLTGLMGKLLQENNCRTMARGFFLADVLADVASAEVRGNKKTRTEGERL